MEHIHLKGSVSVVNPHVTLVNFVITVGNAGDADGQDEDHHRRDDLTLDVTTGRAATRLQIFILRNEIKTD